MWRAPNRPTHEVSQTYNDGVVTVYRVTDSANPGDMPVIDTEQCAVLHYEERTVPIDINCKYINVKLFNAVPYGNDTAFAKINNTQLLSDHNVYFEELKYSESGVTHRVVSSRNPGDIINDAPIMNGSMDISLMPTDTFVGIDTSVFRAGDSESSIWRSTGRLAITSRSGLQLQIWAGDASYMGFGAGTQILVTGVIE